MKFAENNRISHRQLYRQMVLAFLAPFLLCLFGKNHVMGLNGIMGILAALVVLGFYVIFLIRLGPFYADLRKTVGRLLSGVFGLFFVSYVLLTGAYLLSLLEEIVPRSLVTGISGRWISLFAVLVCAVGSHKGMQRRGRIGEVSGAWILGAVLLLLVLGMGQGKLSYLQEMPGAASLSGEAFLGGGYEVLCAFAGIGLLPFGLDAVEKQGSAGKTVLFAIGTLGGILLLLQVLLVAVFGWNRVGLETYPVLPLLGGANLPGNILARFDVVWMAVLLYGFLFSLGSLLHYGNQLLDKSGIGTGHYWLAAAMYFFAETGWGGAGIGDYYRSYLSHVFVPGMILIQIFLMFRGKIWRKGRNKKKGAVLSALLVICMCLTGCTGVEPEKRAYPLALGFDVEGQEADSSVGSVGFAGSAEEGSMVDGSGVEGAVKEGSVVDDSVADGSGADGQVLSLTYGMPDLPQATGQEKAGEEGKQALTILGGTFGEIEESYNRSQEKYLDLGHLEILVLGAACVENGRWQELVTYLEQEPFVGENVYVFRAENARAVLEWTSVQGTSVGEYLQGILENRVDGQQKKGVTLREVIHEKDKTGKLVSLPYIQLGEKELQIRATN